MTNWIEELYKVAGKPKDVVKKDKKSQSSGDAYAANRFAINQDSIKRSKLIADVSSRLAVSEKQSGKDPGGEEEDPNSGNSNANYKARGTSSTPVFFSGKAPSTPKVAPTAEEQRKKEKRASVMNKQLTRFAQVRNELNK